MEWVIAIVIGVGGFLIAFLMGSKVADYLIDGSYKVKHHIEYKKETDLHFERCKLHAEQHKEWWNEYDDLVLAHYIKKYRYEVDAIFHMQSTNDYDTAKRLIRRRNFNKPTMYLDM